LVVSISITTVEPSALVTWIAVVESDGGFQIGEVKLVVKVGVVIVGLAVVGKTVPVPLTVAEPGHTPAPPPITGVLAVSAPEEASVPDAV